MTPQKIKLIISFFLFFFLFFWWNLLVSLNHLTVTSMATKVCTHCQHSKPLESFGMNKRGILNHCTSCFGEGRDQKAGGREDAHIGALNAAVSLTEFTHILETIKDNEYHTNSIVYDSPKDVLDIRLSFSGNVTTQLDPSVETGLSRLKEYSDHLVARFQDIFGYRWRYVASYFDIMFYSSHRC